MFMGSDGGFLGIGAPELATILLVGYFVLGPSDLYKLVKEIGKFGQNIRTLGLEATKTFEDQMESQLDLAELRKAQQELNDAFSFRRTINVDGQGDAFSTVAATYDAGDAGPKEAVAEVGAAAAAAAAATTATATEEAPKPRKKKRRRVKKKQPAPEPTVTSKESTTTTTTGSVPDLDMGDAFVKPSTVTTTPKDDGKADWFADGKLPSASDMAKEDLEWLASSSTNETATTTATTAPTPADPMAGLQEQSRFQQQMSGNWNDSVMDNEDKLAPMALVMEKLALLEEERAAADKRLEDEFRQRFQLEEDFYRQKRELLEETAAKVQEDAYVTMDNKNGSKN